MSDLVSGGPIPAAGGNGRALNGGSRSASGPVPVPQYPSSGVRTPTVIMQQRRERDARKQAEREAKQREQEEDERRRAQGTTGPGGDSRTVNVGVEGGPVGGGDPSSSRQQATYLGAASASRRSGDPQDTGERRRSERLSSSNAARVNAPAGPQPTTAGSRRQQPISGPQPTNTTAVDDSNMAQAPTSRTRGATVSKAQSRPVESQAPRAVSAPYNTRSQPAQSRQTTQPRVTSQPPAGPTTNPQAPQPIGGAQSRNPNTSSFPHAFERWETLSSHWEGLTSYWIRRLDQNSEELNREPLNQQLARQVTDLSAAGANLFHAVVELQRLRASSERKFQRWFFETRADQEQARETQGEMESALRTERLARTEAVANATRMEAEKNTAEQLVKEMRRELQISKEEARRAWEELGRREQEERDRTTSLRNGEPTLVGGVQVVPMMQGAPSRQVSTNRPTTREGPFPGVTEPSSGTRDILRAQEEPGESPLEGEPSYGSYDPTKSETDTDPFTAEGSREVPARSLLHEPDLPALPRQQTAGISGAVTEAATAMYPPIPAPQAPTVTPASSGASPARAGTYLQYGPGGASLPIAAPFYQHQGSALHGEDRPKPGEPDERSYVPSVDDTISEEEFELDAHGQIRRDTQGQPIIDRRGLGSEDSDEYDVQEQLERERIHGQRYGSGISGVEYGRGPTATAAGTRPRPLFQAQGEQMSPSDFTASGYGPGWEAVPRHHHPTRLSDVLEEDERSRGTRSRASQTSRGLH